MVFIPAARLFAAEMLPLLQTSSKRELLVPVRSLSGQH
jgi:hypothetical protein